MMGACRVLNGQQCDDNCTDEGDNTDKDDCTEDAAGRYVSCSSFMYDYRHDISLRPSHATTGVSIYQDLSQLKL